MALAVVGCAPGNDVAGGITMLRYGPMPGSPAAIATGTLRLRDGCIWLDDGEEPAAVVLWPWSAHFGAIEAPLRVVVGNVFAADGDTVQMAGGEYLDQMDFVETLVGSVPEPCRVDRYWLASTLERLGP